MEQMVYAVVRRTYGNYDDEDAEMLVRMFATFKEAEEYVLSRVMVFRPIKVKVCNDTDVYEYGMMNTADTVARAEFPQYVIRPFLIEGTE